MRGASFPSTKRLAGRSNMPMSENHDDARAVGLDPRRWQGTLDLLADWCRRGLIPSAAIVCGRSDRFTRPQFFGRQAVEDEMGSLREDAIFLVASITKPIVALGALLLVERGQLSLDDRVCEIVSSFRGRGKYGVTVRHLLTHTSGLPDMLPNNRELRESHSPLEAFLAGACAAEMGFPPGRGVRYQSMGFAVLGEIVRSVSGRACADFLRTEIFEPLWMNDTSLGAPEEWTSGPEGKSERGSPRSASRKTSGTQPSTGVGTAATGGAWVLRGAEFSQRPPTWRGSPG